MLYRNELWQNEIIFQNETEETPAPKEEDEEFHDLGFSSFAVKNRKRFVNKDGSFNVIRSASFFKDFHIYQFLVSMSWTSFACTTMLFLFCNQLPVCRIIFNHWGRISVRSRRR